LILTAVFLSIQVCWDWHRVVGSVNPDVLRREPLAQRQTVIWQKTWMFWYKCPFCPQRQGLWLQVYKDIDTAKCSGTATRLHTMWNCSTIVEFYIAIILILLTGALRFNQCRCCSSVGGRTVKRVWGKNVGASRMHSLSPST